MDFTAAQHQVTLLLVSSWWETPRGNSSHVNKAIFSGGKRTFRSQHYHVHWLTEPLFTDHFIPFYVNMLYLFHTLYYLFEVLDKNNKRYKQCHRMTQMYRHQGCKQGKSEHTVTLPSCCQLYLVYTCVYLFLVIMHIHLLHSC